MATILEKVQGVKARIARAARAAGRDPESVTLLAVSKTHPVARIAEAQAAGKEIDRRKLNVSLLMEAQEVLKIDSWLSINPEGALWYRGLSTVTDDPKGGPFAALLEKYGAKRFVTGHTPQQNRSITVRFGGRAVLIDTGMLTSYYKGRASALEIDGDKLTAYYEDGKVTLP